MTKSRSRSANKFNNSNELKVENRKQTQNKSYNFGDIKNQAFENKSNISYEKAKLPAPDLEPIMDNK